MCAEILYSSSRKVLKDQLTFSVTKFLAIRTFRNIDAGEELYCYNGHAYNLIINKTTAGVQKLYNGFL